MRERLWVSKLGNKQAGTFKNLVYRIFRRPVGYVGVTNGGIKVSRKKDAANGNGSSLASDWNEVVKKSGKSTHTYCFKVLYYTNQMSLTIILGAC